MLIASQTDKTTVNTRFIENKSCETKLMYLFEGKVTSLV